MSGVDDVIGADHLLTPAEVATVLSVSKSTLTRWRQSGTGPPCVWLSEGLPRYRALDLAKWLERRAA